MLVLCHGRLQVIFLVRMTEIVDLKSVSRGVTRVTILRGTTPAKFQPTASRRLAHYEYKKGLFFKEILGSMLDTTRNHHIL